MKKYEPSGVLLFRVFFMHRLQAAAVWSWHWLLLTDRLYSFTLLIMRYSGFTLLT